MARNWSNERERREDHYLNRLSNLWDRVVAQHGNEIKDLLADGGSAEDVFDSVLNRSLYFTGGMLAFPNLRRATWDAITSNITDWDSKLMDGYQSPQDEDEPAIEFFGAGSDLLQLGDLVSGRQQANFVRLGLFGRPDTIVGPEGFSGTGDFAIGKGRIVDRRLVVSGISTETGRPIARGISITELRNRGVNVEDKKAISDFLNVEPRSANIAVYEKRQPLTQYYLPDGRVGFFTTKQAERLQKREAVTYPISVLLRRQRELRTPQEETKLVTVRTPFGREVETGVQVKTGVKVDTGIKVPTPKTSAPNLRVQRAITSDERKVKIEVTPTEEQKEVRERIAMYRRNQRRKKEIEQETRNQTESSQVSNSSKKNS